MGKSETGVGEMQGGLSLPMAYHCPCTIIAHGLSLPMAYIAHGLSLRVTSYELRVPSSLTRN